MSDALSFAEIDGQHVELLPARTVMSMFTVGAGSGGNGGNGGPGGKGAGGVGVQLIPVTVLGDQVNNIGSGTGGPGGHANGGN